jgi:hypothetical protein
MKKLILVDNNKENYGERKKKVRKNNENLFIIIPIEVINLIVSFCDIVETHMFRFVSKEFHRLAHKYGATWDGFFFRFKRLNRETIYFEAAREGHLSILKWMKPWFPTVCSSADDKSIYKGAARGGHLKILKRYAQR